MIITPGQKPSDTGKSLETSGGKVDLPRIKDELRDVQTAAFDYAERLDCAQRWWNSIWEGQTQDGRKWWKYEDETDPFPWPGSSDTRVRLVKKMVREYRTICLYALMNLRMQAKSTRPAASIRESQQVTTMLNWQIFTHMEEEWFRESELLVTMAAVNGCSVMSIDWEQERRLDFTPITLQQFGLLIQKVTGQPLSYRDLSDIIDGSEYEKELIAILQVPSEVLTTAGARKILNELRRDGEST